MISDIEFTFWITLQQIPECGPSRIHKLLKAANGDIEQLFNVSDSWLKLQGLSDLQLHSFRHPTQSIIDNCLTWLHSSDNHHFIPISNSLYPEQLKQISQAPVGLFVFGNPDILSLAQLAVIGSRAPTQAGKEVARSLAAEISESGWIVTSGLATGIDGCAHQGAVMVHRPTIAVLGTGVDIVYPRRHIKLAEQIIETGGALVSEFLPGTQAKAHHFPRRNRIIAGLSKGVLVVEAAIKSGSLITCRYALEQDREVFAVPGNIRNPQSKGCHFLIKRGAKLVEEVEDINEEFQNLSFNGAEAASKNRKKSTEQSLATDKLLDSVDYEATAIDVVAERSGLPIEVVTATLLEYELRGLVSATSGGYIRLRG